MGIELDVTTIRLILLCATLETLGFGSLIVTYRNCPNNAPLALWVDAPWYPLFPRTTNTQTAVRRMFADLTGGDL